MKWDKIVVLVVVNQIDTLFGVLVESNGCVVGCRVKSEGEKQYICDMVYAKKLYNTDKLDTKQG